MAINSSIIARGIALIGNTVGHEKFAFLHKTWHLTNAVIGIAANTVCLRKLLNLLTGLNASATEGVGHIKSDAVGHLYILPFVCPIAPATVYVTASLKSYSFIHKWCILCIWLL